MNLIRAIFPRWNFFDRVGSSFELEYQIQGHGDWKKISFESPRTLASLVINTNLNEALAQVSLIEQFVQEESLTGYKMICSLLRVKAGNDPMKFQIVAVDQLVREVVYESEWINL